jgi:hypothetical protein
MAFFILISFLAMQAVGFGLMIQGAVNAPVGFEDEFGFHGVVPAGRAATVHVYVGPDRRYADGRRAEDGDFGRRRVAGPRSRRTDIGSSPLSSLNGEGTPA